MGKRLIQQRRGRGSSTFRAKGFNSRGPAKLPRKDTSGIVVDIVTSTHHSAPLLKIKYADKEEGLLIAPEGIKVGDTITIGAGEVANGNALALGDIPIGVLVYNIEGEPGDGGKFVRGSGGVGRIVGKQDGKVTVLLPSKKRRVFNAKCRALLGTVAGGGRMEKPLVRAGTKFHKMKAKNKYWPIVSGTAMNAVAHPFGGKRTSRKGRPTIAPRNAPPGRMVGMIRPRKTGRARGTRVRKS